MTAPCWIIVRTDLAKEHYVCRQIESMGYEAWCPTELRSCRITPHSKARKMTEHPILPKRLVARVPVAMHGDLAGIRYLVAIDRDAASAPLCVPHSQIVRFRAAIDTLNRDTLALAELRKPKREKAKWRDMREALESMIQSANAQMQEVA